MTTAPVLSSLESHLLTLSFSSIYVGSIYASRHTRISIGSNSGKEPQEEKSRDHPDVIKARLVAVTLATLISVGLVYALVDAKVVPLESENNSAISITLDLLGLPKIPKNLTPTSLWWSIRPHLVTPLLFLGPLYASHYLTKTLPFQHNWSYLWHFKNTFANLIGIRNYLMAPITEELVFRSCVLAVYHLGGVSINKSIFLSPLSFGLAHVHHAYETYVRLGRTADALKRAVLISTFQLAYTTLFGFHCAFLFLRSSSILPPITAHIFCNVMGLPQISYELQRFPRQKFSIIGTYTLGIVLYIVTMKQWTLNTDSIYWD